MVERMLLKLQDTLGYNFEDISLLDAALTHSSYANENRKIRRKSNERLEFLGDAVLGMAVSKLLFDAAKDIPEGKMTRLRAEIVCERSLFSIAKQWGLGSYIKLGRGEIMGGGRERPSILADAVEAIIAAMYLDGGLEPVSALINKFLAPQQRLLKLIDTDYKTSLQELIQKNPGQQLSYRIVEESGPDHDKFFLVEVLLDEIPFGTGDGKSKKVAEQNAAKAALRELLQSD